MKKIFVVLTVTILFYGCATITPLAAFLIEKQDFENLVGTYLKH